MWNLKCDTNKHYLPNKNRLTDIENKLTFAKWEEAGGEGSTGSLGLAETNCYMWDG